MTTEDRNQHFFDVINPELSRLAGRICEASAIDDRVVEQSRYKDLLTFYEEQVAEGFWHPSLTESLADFTASRDAQASLHYYRLALEQARELESDSYTILIAMAEALFEAGHREQAEACLRDGRAAALQQEDYKYVQEADNILRDASAS
ncbi:MAG: tetratricopeptide repeat protein [Verrucomicrobia bacterium]|nr:tetratricopeptide repeat protein [Verrucomicrobiota bacterium]